VCSNKWKQNAPERTSVLLDDELGEEELGEVE